MFTRRPTERTSNDRRVLLTVGVVAVVVAGGLGVLAVRSTRDESQSTTNDVTVTVPDTEPAPDTESVPGTESVPDTVIVPDTAPTVATKPAVIDGADPADAYLTDTTVVYERTMPDGRVIVARLSAAPYSRVFGIGWNAPTGSAERCLGDRADFLGEPGVVGPWGSAWVTSPWYEAPTIQAPEVELSMGSASQLEQYFLIRTPADIGEVSLILDDGAFIDTAVVNNGLAILVAPNDALDAGWSISMVSTTGEPSGTAPLGYGTVAMDRPECSPGPEPMRPLPEPGAQPGNPSAAEAQIRQRHALLVNRSIARDDKPQDLLDDDTGVQDALAQVDAGQFSESAAGATYTIDDLVFTAPDTAWFTYTITAPTGTFGGRFGNATFNGRVWQITRTTICQDLALAQGTCQPLAPAIEPPRSEQWEADFQEWAARANLYNAGDGCAPLSQC